MDLPSKLAAIALVLFLAGLIGAAGDNIIQKSYGYVFIVFGWVFLIAALFVH